MFLFNVYFIITAKVAYNFERFDHPIFVEEITVKSSYEDCATSYIEQLRADFIILNLKKGKVDALIPTLSLTNKKFLNQDIQFFNEYFDKFSEYFKDVKHIYLKVIGAKKNGKKQINFFTHFQEILQEKFNSAYMIDLKKLSSVSFEKIMHFKE